MVQHKVRIDRRPARIPTREYPQMLLHDFEIRHVIDCTRCHFGHPCGHLIELRRLGHRASA